MREMANVNSHVPSATTPLKEGLGQRICIIQKVEPPDNALVYHDQRLQAREGANTFEGNRWLRLQPTLPFDHHPMVALGRQGCHTSAAGMSAVITGGHSKMNPGLRAHPGVITVSKGDRALLRSGRPMRVGSEFQFPFRVLLSLARRSTPTPSVRWQPQTRSWPGTITAFSW
jgi:hypothetical protein